MDCCTNLSPPFQRPNIKYFLLKYQFEQSKPISSQAEGKWSFKFQWEYFPASWQEERKTDKLKCFPNIDTISGLFIVHNSTSGHCLSVWGDTNQFYPIFWMLHFDIIRNCPQPSPHLWHFILLETAETITSHFHFITHHTLGRILKL